MPIRGPVCLPFDTSAPRPTRPEGPSGGRYSKSDLLSQPSQLRHAGRRAAGLVLPLPSPICGATVQDAALDLVISIFAPKNFRETARVLRPGGCFALVYPRANHLVELRQRCALMRHHKTRPNVMPEL
jgi:SAM-dependent methyltransferase